MTFLLLTELNNWLSFLLTKQYTLYNIFCDISTFKRTFNSILHVECSAHYMQRRNKTSDSKFVNISSILTKIYRYFGLARDISLFKRTFYSILDAECSAHYMQRRNKPSDSKFVNISSILTKIYSYFGLARDISSFKRIC